MALTQCPGCQTAFKVPPESMGKELRCPKCRTKFAARGRRAGGGRAAPQSMAGYYWAGFGLLAFVAIIAVMTRGDDKAKTSAKTGAGTGRAGTESSITDRSFAGSSGSSEPSPEPLTRDELRARVDAVLAAVRAADSDQLQRQLVNFPMFQDHRAQDSDALPWAELPGLDKNLVRGEICELVLGSPEDRDFLNTAREDPVAYTTVESKVDRAKVFLVHRGQGDAATRRLDLDLEFSRTPGTDLWMLSHLKSTGVYDEEVRREEEKVAAAEVKQEQAEVRTEIRRRNLGTIAPVEHLAGTTPEKRAELEALAAKLTDLSLTREMSRAKRALVAEGKAAIPPLLNIIAPRGKLSGREDAMIVNQAVDGLRRITMLDGYGFAPSSNPGSAAGAESTQVNIDALRQWFGWWDKNKDTWTGPEESSANDEG